MKIIYKIYLNNKKINYKITLHNPNSNKNNKSKITYYTYKSNKNNKILIKNKLKNFMMKIKNFIKWIH
jgi:hypothetical protein